MDKPDNIVTRRKMGRFTIVRDLIEHDPGSVLSMLNGCIVVRAETKWNMTVEYEAFHASFEAVDRGATPPLYIAELVRESADKPARFNRWVKI